MKPNDTRSPHRPRAPLSPRRMILLTITIAVPLLACVGWPAYMVSEFLKGPYDDRVIWYYDDFRMVGGPTAADSLRAKDVLPRNIIVEELTSRFISPESTVLELGRRVELSSITWDSALEMSPKEPLRLPDGDDMVQMLDPHGDGSSHITVHFEGKKFKSLSAWNDVRIHNTSNGQSMDLLADWSDVERVFGKPKSKEKKRLYIGWGTGS
jgi:hypothetical protein